jgi:hypothetical protein
MGADTAATAVATDLMGAGVAAGAGAGAAATLSGVAAWDTALAGATAVGAAAAVPAVGSSLLKGAGQALGAGVVSSLLQPKPPGVPAPTLMPDPQAQEAAKKKALLEQTARRGRQSTVLTEPGNPSDKLGG